MSLKNKRGSLTLDKTAATSISGTGDEWVDIQRKTFTNWANEQLSVSGRTIQDVGTDFCDGVNLVALVEALQFRKIGRVYAAPQGRIQMLQNVGLAFKAISQENIKLVNLGSEDLVNGNLKLTLGLLWHLILRYQLASTKSKAPPKKLMLSWFQNILPEVEMGNFPSDWRDGKLLHALLNRLKPGVSPDWKKLESKNAIENCRSAMKLANEHFNIPRVVAPEDFASAALDDLSAMTYLSYFIKVDSPGYYDILNWVCRQLRTTLIANLTTDWNDGYYLCSIVDSLGGSIEGFPDLDRGDHVGNCQKGIDGAKLLGVHPILSAAEMADPNLDHLSVMAYLSKFQNITPKRSNKEKIKLTCGFQKALVSSKVIFRVEKLERDINSDKVKIQIDGPSRRVAIGVLWKDRIGECTFTTETTGEHKIHLFYDTDEVIGSPHSFMVVPDKSKLQMITKSCNCKVGTPQNIRVFDAGSGTEKVTITTTSPSQNVEQLDVSRSEDELSSTLNTTETGQWKINVLFEEEEITGSPIYFTVYDPTMAYLQGPTKCVAGDEIEYIVNAVEAGCDDIQVNVMNNRHKLASSVIREKPGYHIIKFKPLSAGKITIDATLNGHPIAGCPKEINVEDLSQISVDTIRLQGAQKGVESTFVIATGELVGDIDVQVKTPDGDNVECSRIRLEEGIWEYSFLPRVAGHYAIVVSWNGRNIKGSPYQVNVGDRTKISLVNDLTELRDDSDRIALRYNKLTNFSLNIADAGQGEFTAEVLGPSGKIPIEKTQNQTTAEFSFKASDEGNHYIHMYYSQVPLEFSPLLAYCPGRPLPLNSKLVHVDGNGIKSARAGVSTEFSINGREAGPGVPRVKLQGVHQNVDVSLNNIKYDRYVCRYTAPTPGSYLLNVWWSDDEVPGSPFKISVTVKGDYQKVNVFGDGLKGGIVGQELRVAVDTRKAGKGEITASCCCNDVDARCEVFDHDNDTYTVRIFSNKTGGHILNIMYDGDSVPGSPFLLNIGEPPDPDKVRVFGPGIEDGVIQTFESRFLVDTSGAGTGRLAVRIRGPRGGFKVEMERGDDTARTILCKYDPTEAGEYCISVKWSGKDVTGSPFNVKIFETLEDLHHCLRQKGLISEQNSHFLWSDEI